MAKRFQVKKLSSAPEEVLRIDHKSFRAVLLNLTGKSGDYWVSYFPSINVSGYGLNENEAIEDLLFNTKIFIEDLFQLPLNKRIEELKKLGWEQKKYFKKKLKKNASYELNIKELFDNPDEIKREILQVA